MWTETNEGLYKKFECESYTDAWKFLEEVNRIFAERGQFARWQNDRSVVEFWLSGHEQAGDMLLREFAAAIDTAYEGIASKNLQLAEDDVLKTTNFTELQLFADGGSRGNPGPSASGFVLLDMEGNVVFEQGVFLGITTNNQAEYQALRLGLEAAQKNFRVRTLHVYMDSLLVINQIQGIFKVKNRDLWPIHEAIKRQIPAFEKITFQHVPREQNKLADAEVNKCLDAQMESGV